MGSAVVSFCNSLGPALRTSMGQAIFATTFTRRVRLVPGINAAQIVRVVATDLKAVLTPDVLPALREAYNYALIRAFVLGIVCSAITFYCSLAMK